MTRRWTTLVALLLILSGGAACGKYGRPIRSRPTPPTTGAQPSASAPATTGAQPASSAPAGQAAPAGESCEDDAEKETTP